MNAAKVTLTATVLAAALGLALGLSAVPSGSYACNTGVKHGGSAEGQPCGVSASGEVFPVKVTFDDVVGDSIQSDDGGPYIDGVADVAAEIPVEGSPPGQLLVFLGGKEPRTFSFDFGAAEDCADADPETLGCVRDNSTETGVLVECPFPVGERDNNDDTQCAGKARGGLFARDPLEINGSVMDRGYILTMDEAQRLMRAREREVEFSVGNTVWRIDFDDVTCDVNPPVAGAFLDIEAFEFSPATPGLFREAWHISTGPEDDSTKGGCLSKTRGVKKTIPNGNFDLSFGYTVCILDPDSVVDACFLE